MEITCFLFKRFCSYITNHLFVSSNFIYKIIFFVLQRHRYWISSAKYCGKKMLVVNQPRLSKGSWCREQQKTEMSKEPHSPIIILLPAVELMTPRPICLRPQRVRIICDLSLSLLFDLFSLVIAYVHASYIISPCRASNRERNNLKICITVDLKWINLCEIDHNGKMYLIVLLS